MKDYNGILIGISAGSMNCSKIVYSPPESNNDANNPMYSKWFNGLGFTNINILPHFKKEMELVFGDIKMKEDIILPDSYKHPIYGINDGSFIEIDNSNKIIFHGDCYKIINGTIEQINIK